MLQANSAMSRRAALAGALALLCAGCFGEFAATRTLYKWNTEVSPNKWLRWLVFLVLAILPVYGLFILADAIVLNTIEFFSGKNPVSNSHVQLGHGNTVLSSRTGDPNLIRHEHRHDGRLVRVLYVRRVSEREFWVLDDRMRLLTRVELGKNGDFVTRDAAGRELSRLSGSALDAIGAAFAAGGSPSESVRDALAQEVELASAEP